MSRALLVIACGLPGTGKTTLCDALRARADDDDRVAQTLHVSFDALERASLQSSSSRYDPLIWRFARARGVEIIDDFLKHADANARRVAFADDVHAKRASRRRLARVASARDASRACVYLTAIARDGTDVGAKRNAMRSPSERVPEDVIERERAEFEPPGAGERAKVFRRDFASDDSLTVDAHADELWRAISSYWFDDAQMHKRRAKSSAKSVAVMRATTREDALADAEASSRRAVRAMVLAITDARERGRRATEINASRREMMALARKAKSVEDVGALEKAFRVSLEKASASSNELEETTVDQGDRPVSAVIDTCVE